MRIDRKPMLNMACEPCDYSWFHEIDWGEDADEEPRLCPKCGKPGIILEEII